MSKTSFYYLYAYQVHIILIYLLTWVSVLFQSFIYLQTSVLKIIQLKSESKQYLKDFHFIALIWAFNNKYKQQVHNLWPTFMNLNLIWHAQDMILNFLLLRYNPHTHLFHCHCQLNFDSIYIACMCHCFWD